MVLIVRTPEHHQHQFPGDDIIHQWLITDYPSTQTETIAASERSSFVMMGGITSLRVDFDEASLSHFCRITDSTRLR
jgi:hypothetical protein